jgi:hypothetical protein
MQLKTLFQHVMIYWTRREEMEKERKLCPTNNRGEFLLRINLKAYRSSRNESGQNEFKADMVGGKLVPNSPEIMKAPSSSMDIDIEPAKIAEKIHAVPRSLRTPHPSVTCSKLLPYDGISENLEWHDESLVLGSQMEFSHQDATFGSEATAMQLSFSDNSFSSETMDMSAYVSDFQEDYQEEIGFGPKFQPPISSMAVPESEQEYRQTISIAPSEALEIPCAPSTPTSNRRTATFSFQGKCPVTPSYSLPTIGNVSFTTSPSYYNRSSHPSTPTKLSPGPISRLATPSPTRTLPDHSRFFAEETPSTLD